MEPVLGLLCDVCLLRNLYSHQDLNRFAAYSFRASTFSVGKKLAHINEVEVAHFRVSVNFKYLPFLANLWIWDIIVGINIIGVRDHCLKPCNWWSNLRIGDTKMTGQENKHEHN